MIKKPLESQDQVLYSTMPTLSEILALSSATSHPVKNSQTLQWFWSPLYVTQVGRQIVDNVDKNPTIRVLVVVELRTVKRELHKNIVFLNFSSFYSFQII